MRILMIHNYYRQRGGEDFYVDSLTDLLTKQGHQIFKFYRYSATQDHPSASPVTKLSRTSYAHLKHALEVLIGEVRPEIAHVHNLYPFIGNQMYHVLRALQIPVVQTVHNHRLMCLNGLFMLNDGTHCRRCQAGNFFHGVSRKCYQNSLVKSAYMAIQLSQFRTQDLRSPLVNCFICPSHYIKKRMQEMGVAENRLSCLPHFLEPPADILPVKQDNQKPYAVYLGRLSKEKGVLTLLKAFEDMNDIELKVIGEGELASLIDQHIREKRLNHIARLGYVTGEEKLRLIGSAACLVAPSECEESFGLSVLEGFRLGVPVIATDLGSLPELVCDGKNGWLISPGDVNALRTAVKQASFQDDKTCLQMSQCAKQTFEEKHTPQVVYFQLLEVYQRARSLLAVK
ncbi:MAG: hypothetical protein COV74_09580 [Candidatus Omnitrophica bacterium CG11_big_fil_rev_8_21_14_0_20_45_26]|uniref:Uncharacterized protein n=1 Tax=Candidatus Abzuiibacterium crystallinum TaxID=1974748 RepID=A0A2H0LLD0_9BACT|nr:MAG: hypothetical protein COV74_09580 [Candidatus Omnitrophica bacterium CG11_big_fil_rev_8_21_14_0_20_45_26]PIW65395.1 MAG: hypothetical protein COW12_02150 [Candidatus Omnitrophica bacterium CG12_big_fil_rev_8_21_14_0_65_45_16]